MIPLKNVTSTIDGQKAEAGGSLVDGGQATSGASDEGLPASRDHGVPPALGGPGSSEGQLQVIERDGVVVSGLVKDFQVAELSAEDLATLEGVRESTRGGPRSTWRTSGASASWRASSRRDPYRRRPVHRADRPDDPRPHGRRRRLGRRRRRRRRRHRPPVDRPGMAPLARSPRPRARSAAAIWRPRPSSPSTACARGRARGDGDRGCRHGPQRDDRQR